MRRGVSKDTADTVHRLDGLEHGLAQIARVLASLCVFGMLAAAGVTLIDVLLRWMSRPMISALNEIVTLLFAVAISACIPAGLAARGNLKVDMIGRWIVGHMAAWMDVLGASVLLIFYGLLAWQIGAYAARLAAEGRTTMILRWPEAPFIYAVALLLSFGVLVQLVIVCNTARHALSYAPRSAADETALPVRLLVGLFFLLLLALALGVGFEFDALAHWAQAHIGVSVTLAFTIMWLLAMGVIPVAAVMGLVGLVGAALFIGFGPAFSAYATEVSGFLTNGQVSTLPLFLMMGSFAATADVSDDIYRLMHLLLGRLRGGLALATIGGCAGFGSLTGNSLATAAVIGRVSLPQMMARGYSPALATGCCAAGGTLGALLPPASGPLILFALLSDASIGQLFVAAIVPGLLAVLLYFATVMIYARVSPGSAPLNTEPIRGQLWPALRRCGPAALLFASVLGGIYTGIFTSAEAAAAGAFESFMLALLRGKLRGGAFLRVLAETMATTAMIYGLIFGAQIFSFYIQASELAESMTSFIASLHFSAMAVIAIILTIYLILGSFMESFAVMVITVPVVTPLVLGFGYDITWWGIINICIVETGLIHPPLGLNVFVLKSMQPEVPLWTIYRGVFPFVGADLVKLVLLVLFPSLTTWLATTMLR